MVIKARMVQQADKVKKATVGLNQEEMVHQELQVPLVYLDLRDNLEREVGQVSVADLV